MKFLTILTVLTVALLSGCATTSDIEESEMRLNARLDAQERLILLNTQNLAAMDTIMALRNTVVNTNTKDIIETNIKIDRMFNKAMIK